MLTPLTSTPVTPVLLCQPAIVVIVALKHPFSRLPPSPTKAAIVRSANRPLGDVPHSTHRSQNSLAIDPSLVTGSTAARSAHSLRMRTVAPSDRYGSRTQPMPPSVGRAVPSGSIAGYASPSRPGGSSSGSCQTADPLMGMGTGPPTRGGLG